MVRSVMPSESMLGFSHHESFLDSASRYIMAEKERVFTVERQMSYRPRLHRGSATCCFDPVAMNAAYTFSFVPIQASGACLRVLRSTVCLQSIGDRGERLYNTLTPKCSVAWHKVGLGRLLILWLRPRTTRLTDCIRGERNSYLFKSISRDDVTGQPLKLRRML